MYLRRLKNVTKKTCFLRCFWERFEMSLSMNIWLKTSQRHLMRAEYFLAQTLFYFKLGRELESNDVNLLSIFLKSRKSFKEQKYQVSFSTISYIRLSSQNHSRSEKTLRKSVNLYRNVVGLYLRKLIYQSAISFWLTVI